MFILLSKAGSGPKLSEGKQFIFNQSGMKPRVLRENAHPNRGQVAICAIVDSPFEPVIAYDPCV